MKFFFFPLHRSPRVFEFRPASLLIFAALSMPLTAATNAEELIVVADLDNTLFQSNSGETSSGVGPSLYAGRVNYAENDHWERRAVLRFDVSAIPEGSNILEVTMRMQVTRSPPQPPINLLFELHECLNQWGEGGSSSNGGAGAPSQSGDATWYQAIYPNVNWSNPGGDFTPTASGTTIVNENGSYVFTGDGLTIDVQRWVDGGENFGWVMTAPVTELRTVRQIASRQNGNSSFRPTLTVTYEEGSGDIPGDFNGDGLVNGADFGLLLIAWGNCRGCPEDLDGNGVVNGADIGLLLTYWTG